MAGSQHVIWITTRSITPGTLDEFREAWRPKKFPDGMLRAYEGDGTDRSDIIGIAIFDSRESLRHIPPVGRGGGATGGDGAVRRVRELGRLRRPRARDPAVLRPGPARATPRASGESRSDTTRGFAFPSVSFITWPTKNPSRPSFPPRYASTWPGLASRMRATTGSSSAVSETASCARYGSAEKPGVAEARDRLVERGARDAVARLHELRELRRSDGSGIDPGPDERVRDDVRRADTVCAGGDRLAPEPVETAGDEHRRALEVELACRDAVCGRPEAPEAPSGAPRRARARARPGRGPARGSSGSRPPPPSRGAAVSAPLEASKS